MGASIFNCSTYAGHPRVGKATLVAHAPAARRLTATPSGTGNFARSWTIFRGTGAPALRISAPLPYTGIKGRPADDPADARWLKRTRRHQGPTAHLVRRRDRRSRLPKDCLSGSGVAIEGRVFALERDAQPAARGFKTAIGLP